MFISINVVLYTTGAILIPVGTRHGLKGNMVILIGRIARHIEVGKVRFILVFILRHWIYHLVSDGFVVFKALMRLF
jgi:hypothetical protein